MLPLLTSADERIQIGRGTYASGEPLLRPHHPENKIIIGNYCSLAYGVSIFAGGNHPMNYITTHPIRLHHGVSDFPGWTADCQDGSETTKIGNDVWLGHECTILSGSEIGDGAAIGARAVVRGKIPAYAIAIGNPAVVIRYRFSPEIIASLLRIQWWNWSDEKIKSLANEIGSPNIHDFLSAYENM